jgi:hypothetical protein
MAAFSARDPDSVSRFRHSCDDGTATRRGKTFRHYRQRFALECEENDPDSTQALYKQVLEVTTCGTLTAFTRKSLADAQNLGPAGYRNTKMSEPRWLVLTVL